MRNRWCLLLSLLASAYGPEAHGQNRNDSIESAGDNVLGAQVGVPSLDSLIADSVKAELLEPLCQATSLTTLKQQDDSVLVKTKRSRLHTTGGIEVGGIRGSIPYTLSSPGSWNGYVKGTVSSDLFGIPLKVIFDLGTDLPVRGQRNSVRFAFDPTTMVVKDRWSEAGDLHHEKASLDSLNAEKVTAYRKLMGAEST